MFLHPSKDVRCLKEKTDQPFSFAYHQCRTTRYILKTQLLPLMSCIRTIRIRFRMQIPFTIISIYFTDFRSETSLLFKFHIVSVEITVSISSFQKIRSLKKETYEPNLVRPYLFFIHFPKFLWRIFK